MDIKIADSYKTPVICYEALRKQDCVLKNIPDNLSEIDNAQDICDDKRQVKIFSLSV